MKGYPLHIGGSMPLSFPQPSISTMTKSKILLIATTRNALSGIVWPFKNKARLMAHSVYSTGGMHRFSTYVQEGGIMFFSKLYLVVWETVLPIGTKWMTLDWKMLTTSTPGYAKYISCSLGFPFQQKQSCLSFHLQLKAIYWWCSGSLNEKYVAPGLPQFIL